VIPRALPALIAVFGCGLSPHSHPARNQYAERLVGAWYAELSLTRPYSLGLRPAPAGRICGTIGFVGNHYAMMGTSSDTADILGVYDLDLSRLGLGWNGDVTFPSALAVAPKEPAGEATPPVTIVLNPGSQERIVLVGNYDGRRLSGDWLAQSSRGSASGSFHLDRNPLRRGECPASTLLAAD
jgi:hypothetical protein